MRFTQHLSSRFVEMNTLAPDSSVLFLCCNYTHKSTEFSHWRCICSSNEKLLREKRFYRFESQGKTFAS